MKFFSLKPRNEIGDIKNYNTYKEALDYCFEDKNNINNIGIVGDYGTGKSTIISTYISNDLDTAKYDVINVSLLTLEDMISNSTDILKNIIKQIVHNPKKKIEYNILKFKPFNLDFETKISIGGFVLLYIVVFFMNTNLLSSIPFLSLYLNLFPIEIFRIAKYFLLVAIPLLFIYFIYPKLLSGIKINKFKVASALDAEVKRSTEDIINEELDYLEYLIYLLKREDNNLLLIIEDIDRFNNIRIFQQLREVNNLLNDTNGHGKYKFVYAVGNSLFSGTSNKCDKVNINEVYQSNFKDNITKFFDFIINITPVMDNQNSYEFIKSNFPHLVESNEILDEDLFMISQYIDSPRVLIDIVNDYRMMKDMREGHEGFKDIKLLYYSILKSRFYNFYEIIHDVFNDLEAIVKYCSNNKGFTSVEEKRKDEFLALCALYALEQNESNHLNFHSIVNVWDSIKNEINISTINEKFSELIIYTKGSYAPSVNLSIILSFTEKKKMEYIFSPDLYRKKVGVEFSAGSNNFSEILSLYYSNNNSIISEIINHVEIERFNDPNKRNFSIKEFLNIDFVKLGILEKILNVSDYNVYISQNYLEINDADFIRRFNLLDDDNGLFILKLFDIDAVLSKMKLEKINDKIGLNVYIIAYLQINNIKDIKAEKLNKNAINIDVFMSTLLHFKFKEIVSKFDKVQFLLDNAKSIFNVTSLFIIIRWFDNQISDKNFEEKYLEIFLSELSNELKFSISDTNYEEITYSCLLKFGKPVKDESALMFIIEKVINGYTNLMNLVFKEYAYFILENEDFSNAVWLTLFNNNISVLHTLLDQDNMELIKSVYENVGKIKVKKLSELIDMDFLNFIYLHKLYDYSSVNLKYICEKFEKKDLLDYIPFSEYSFDNIEQLKLYILNNNISPLDINLEWDKVLIINLMNKMSEIDFEKLLQFFTDTNPISVQDISELSLSYEKLIIFVNSINLYEHTFENISYIYDVLSEHKASYVLETILEDMVFDFETLHADLDRFDEDINVEELIYKALLKNKNVSINIFKKYIYKYNRNFANGDLVSSQEKLLVLFLFDKLELNFDNLILCESSTLKYVYLQKSEIFYKVLSEMSEDEIIKVLEKFENIENEIDCLIGLYNSGNVSINFAQKITVSYLRKFEIIYEKSKLRGITLSLLKPLSSKDQDIQKIITLLENKKGRRTISIQFLDVIDLLSDRDIISYEKLPDNKLLIKYSLITYSKKRIAK